MSAAAAITSANAALRSDDREASLAERVAEDDDPAEDRRHVRRDRGEAITETPSPT